MADFHQTGVITTLHRLGPGDGLERIEAELTAFGRRRPIALVLPALYTEFEGPAMRGIVAELAKVPYLAQVVVALGRASETQYRAAAEFLRPLGDLVRIVHIEGRPVQELLETLRRNGVNAGDDGKGRATWLAYGYVLASARADVIALHDCDIVTYRRDLLARLCYPVASPDLDFVFCKGYYSRVTDRLHGRVTRLLVTPLTRALVRLVGPHPFLAFLDSFRYPLAGEFCMATDLARVNRIPWDWGLEVGVLAEVLRNYSPRRVCQVDIADAYEHKHQALSAEDPERGLMRMTVDICKSLFRTLASEGVVFSDGFFTSLQVAYLRLAEDTIQRYEADAAINGLGFDRHAEALAVESFARGIARAAELFAQRPMGSPLIPNWNRVTAAVPGVLDMVLAAVEGRRA